MPMVQVPALTQIEIEKVFQPFPDSKTWKDGAKRGAIKTASGVKYLVKETMLSQFRDGETCEVEVKTFGDKENPGREIVKKVGWNGQVGMPKQNTRPSMSQADARGAFVTLMCQAWAHAGMIAVDRQAVSKARAEAGAGFDIEYNPQRRDDMDDEIPNF